MAFPRKLEGNRVEDKLRRHKQQYLQKFHENDQISPLIDVDSYSTDVTINGDDVTVNYADVVVHGADQLNKRGQDLYYMAGQTNLELNCVCKLGGLAFIDKKEVVEMAWSLANSKHPFLWVIRPGSVDDLKWNKLVNARIVSRVWKTDVHLENM
ncbi:hypothetical protein GQ457_01G017080 [Hibiscus cannabinus]